MMPPMYKRVRDLLVDAGLTASFMVQTLTWTDTGKLTDRFIVLRSSGGSAIDQTISGDYYVEVMVISAKGVSEYQKSDDAVNSIVEFIKNNPTPNRCVGQISNVGGIPAPVQTTEGRLVYRLMFACLYGE